MHLKRVRGNRNLPCYAFWQMVLSVFSLAGSVRRPVEFPSLDPRYRLSIVAFELGPIGPVDEVVDEQPEGPIAGGVLPSELKGMVPKRRAEFLAGRAASALALARCGCATPHAVGRNPNGSPSWPSGFVGSITHGGGIAAAAVASKANCLGVGIDAEYLMSQSTEEEIASLVVTPGEVASAKEALPGVARSSLVTLAFSAKESLYKCLHPLVGTFFEFQDAELVKVSGGTSGAGEFRLKLRRTLAERFPAGWEAIGRFSFDDDAAKSAAGDEGEDARANGTTIRPTQTRVLTALGI
jgi:enterobactin synthetase component D / holo-[acyl-carrier protein] synthase